MIDSTVRIEDTFGVIPYINGLLDEKKGDITSLIIYGKEAIKWSSKHGYCLTDGNGFEDFDIVSYGITFTVEDKKVTAIIDLIDGKIDSVLFELLECKPIAAFGRTMVTDDSRIGALEVKKSDFDRYSNVGEFFTVGSNLRHFIEKRLALKAEECTHSVREEEGK